MLPSLFAAQSQSFPIFWYGGESGNVEIGRGRRSFALRSCVSNSSKTETPPSAETERPEVKRQPFQNLTPSFFPTHTAPQHTPSAHLPLSTLLYSTHNFDATRLLKTPLYLLNQMQAYQFDIAAAAQHAGLPALPPSDEPSPRTGAVAAANAAARAKDQGGVAVTPPGPVSPAQPPHRYMPRSPPPPPPGVVGGGVVGVGGGGGHGGQYLAQPSHGGFDLASAIAAAAAASPGTAGTGTMSSAGVHSTAGGALTAGSYTATGDETSDASDAEVDAGGSGGGRGAPGPGPRRGRSRSFRLGPPTADSFLPSFLPLFLPSFFLPPCFLLPFHPLPNTKLTRDPTAAAAEKAKRKAKRRKKAKKKRDKDKPKRARSAYTFFVAENRSRIVAQVGV